MKFYFTIILFCYILIQAECNKHSESEYFSFLEKECETASSENFSICEKYKKSQTRTKSRVVANYEVYDNATSHSDIIKLAMPANRCKKEDCQFCCLSSNKCGTKKQCENSQYYIKYVHGIFISLIVILFTFLIVKCYRTDCYPDQSHQDKVSNEDLQNLISLYSILRTNRAKLQS